MFNLEQLVLPRSITDRGLVHLGRLSGLKQLAALGREITGPGLKSLESLTSLEEVSVDGTQINDVGLFHLGRLGILKRLSCRKTQITNKGLSHLRNLSLLQTLRLGHNRISDPGLVHIASLPNLRSLALDHTGVTGAGLIDLKRLKRLEMLDLAGTTVTATDIAPLKQTLPECEFRFPEDPLVAALQTNGNKLLPALEEVATIKTDNNQVIAINIKHRRFSDAALARIRGFRQVQRLSLTGTKVTADGMAALASFIRLEELWIDQTQIGDRGLEQLKRLKGLKRILARNCPVTLPGVITLSQQIPQVEIFPARCKLICIARLAKCFSNGFPCHAICTCNKNAISWLD